MHKNKINNLIKTDYCLAYNQNICQKTLNLKISLLTINDYLNASNNLNCTLTDCSKDNYLAEYSLNNQSEYTLNSDNDIYIIQNGLIKTSKPEEKHNIRPVITLSKNVKVTKGSGTIENPYIIVWN